MAKNKIAPKNHLTIPRLKLNSSDMSKRLDFLVRQLGIEFAKVYHSTTLGLKTEGYTTGHGSKEKTILQTGP